MKNRYINSVLMTILGLALITAGFLIVERFQMEKSASMVELVVDSQDIPKMIAGKSIPLESVVYKLKDVGVTTIAIQEENLERSQKEGSIIWAPGYQILAEGYDCYSAFQGLLAQGLVFPGTIYIYPLKNNRQRILETLEIYFKPEQISNQGGVIVLNAPFDEASRLGFGINPELYAYYSSKGFNVIPRMKNPDRFPEKFLEKKVSLLCRSKTFGTVIFDEKEVLGYPDKIQQAADTLKINNLKYGLVEIIDQKGSSQLAKLMEDRIMRVHSISEDEMKIIKKDEALERLARAVKERSIKVVYLRPFTNIDDYNQILEYNLEYFGQVKAKLEANGFTMGQPAPLSMLRLNPWQLIALCLGVIAGIILLVQLFMPVDELVIYGVLLSTVIVVLLSRIFGLSLFMQKLGAFLAAVVFPLYAVFLTFEKKPSEGSANYLAVLKLFGTIILITIAGAALILGLLADTRFMLGAELFAGIKVSLLLPILVVAAYYFLKVNAAKALGSLKALLAAKVPIREILLGGLLLGILGIAAARSGNFNLFIPSAEKGVRSFLEVLLSVRPRTKEFLIGYPVLMLAIYYYLSGRRKWLWLLLGIGTIGLVSLTNTYCHIHSQLTVSFMRSFNGLVFGIIVGMLLLAAYKVVEKRLDEE